jgi:uncharacterized glyoxalase superfamily protein PhnB
MSTTSMKLQTYLNYGGNCEQALRFYEKHLGGKITRLLTWDQMPGVKDLPPDRQKAIMHARIAIGEIELMASDVPPDQFQPMRSVYLSLSRSTVQRRPNGFTACAPTAARFSCPCRKRFLLFASACCATSSAHPG